MKGSPLIAAVALATVPGLLAAQSEPAEPTAGLFSAWVGTFDLTESLFYDLAPALTRPVGSEQRVQVSFRRVQLPWLGPKVLKASEGPFDEAPRRHWLLVIEPADSSVRVRQLAFREPAAWASLADSPVLLRRLSAADLIESPGCDLWLASDGGQYRGGTRGNGCRLEDDGDYLEFEMLLGEGLYWYRRREFSLQPNELQRELIGYTFFEVEDARLFRCAITDRTAIASEAPTVLSLHDQGGRARFATADGRRLELRLYGRDWPFPGNLDSVQLSLSEVASGRSLALAWNQLGEAGVVLRHRQIEVQCEPMVRERNLLQSRLDRISGDASAVKVGFIRRH